MMFQTLALKFSDVVLIMLKNVKMPTTVGIFDIYDQDFNAHWVERSFITSEPGMLLLKFQLTYI